MKAVVSPFDLQLSAFSSSSDDSLDPLEIEIGVHCLACDNKSVDRFE